VLEESRDEFGLSVFESADCLAKFLSMGLQGGAAQIGHLHVLEVPPDAFIGIQVRSISGQPFQPNGSARFFQQGFYSAAAMNWRAIPDDQQPLVDRLLQMPQKPGCEEAVDRGFMRLESAATIRCDSTDHRQMLPRLPFPKDWCLPAGSPRRSHCRKWIEA